MSEKVVHEWKDMTPVGPCRQRCFEDGRAQFKVFGMGTWMDLAESKSTTARQLAALAARVEELGALTHRLDVALESETRMRGDLRAERDRLLEALVKAEVEVCSCCGEPLPTKSVPSSAWHTLDGRWEHKCPEVHAQAGHFATVPFAEYKALRGECP